MFLCTQNLGAVFRAFEDVFIGFGCSASEVDVDAANFTRRSLAWWISRGCCLGLAPWYDVRLDSRDLGSAVGKVSDAFLLRTVVCLVYAG